MNRLLPRVPNVIRTKKATQKGLAMNQRETVALRGINFSDILQDGDLAASKNISARRYPYIATRNARTKVEGVGDSTYTKCIALSKWNDKLITVCENTDTSAQTIDCKVYYGVGSGKEEIAGGTLNTTVPKQFATVNTKMVIWPDKKFIDFSYQRYNHYVLGNLDSSFRVPSGNDHAVKFYSSGDYIEFSQDDAHYVSLFNKGDVVEISDCVQEQNNGIFHVWNVNPEDREITFEEEHIFVNATETDGVRFGINYVPRMDYICESQNRLWGCYSKGQTIHCSALGDPRNFVSRSGTAEDGWDAAVGSDSNFTGCCRLSSGVLFWKQAKLHKVLGSYPAEYTVFSYDYEGLQDGSAGSMQVVNDTLFYMGTHGVYAYNGGMPTSISEVFGEKLFADGIAGTDGDSLYLSVRDGDTYRLLVYDMRRNIWLQEDDIRCVSFARINDDLYFADDNGDVWLADSGEEDPDIEWFAQFTPFYETIEGYKVYSRLILRAEVPKGAYMTVNIRMDDKTWQTVGRMTGNSKELEELRIPVARCDKFELKLEGKGPCVVHSILREFSVGSEV